jgi:hypothetical protein
MASRAAWPLLARATTRIAGSVSNIRLMAARMTALSSQIITLATGVGIVPATAAEVMGRLHKQGFLGFFFQERKGFLV